MKENKNKRIIDENYKSYTFYITKDLAKRVDDLSEKYDAVSKYRIIQKIIEVGLNNMTENDIIDLIKEVK
jgi:predicted DNA-binding protein